jgi:arylsulfatase A-like enzyme
VSAPPQRLRGARDVIIVAVALALLAAALQVVIFEWRLRVLGQIAWQNGGVPLGRDLIWMTPLSWLLLFAVPAALLVIVAAVFPRAVPLPVPVALFAALASFALLLLVPSIHQIASMLLAMGIGVQLARIAARDSRRALRWLGRTAATLATLFIVAGVATRGTRLVSERRAMATLPAAPDGAPNVLLIIFDTVRASATSLYGYARPTTPELDRLAASSVVFDRAFSTAPWTLPSHGSMFTGRYAGELSARWRAPLDERDRTLAEALASRGYATGAFVANPFYTIHETGLGRGFAHYDDVPASLEQIIASSPLTQTPFVKRLVRNPSREGLWRSIREFDFRLSHNPAYDRKTAGRVNGDFLRWQQTLDGRPFFAFLNYFDAHSPYEPPPGYAERFSSSPTLRDAYDGAVAYMDHEVRVLLDELARRGALDRTIVVVTSDHGELFGEWGLRSHGNGLYPQLVQVPLLVHAPGRVPGGLHVTRAVSQRDLARTLTELSGVAIDPPFPGSSLAAFWNGAAPTPSPVILDFEGADSPETPDEARSVIGVANDTLQYLLRDDGRELMFDLRTVNEDTTNLASAPSRAAALAALRSEVKRIEAMRRPGSTLTVGVAPR